MSDTSRTKLEQGRAAFAFDAAQRGAGLTKSSEYKAYVKKMPMLIKTNGLGAAISFAYSKGKGKTDNAWGLIYQQIYEWLKKDPKSLINLASTNDLMKALINADSPTYRATTVEVLALLNWMRRFADGLITKDN
jgi:CRISPR-associated protein Cmr5